MHGVFIMIWLMRSLCGLLLLTTSMLHPFFLLVPSIKQTLFTRAYKQSITPANTIIAIDFHKVMVRSNTKRRLAILMQSSAWQVMLNHLPIFLYKIYTKQVELVSGEKIFFELVKEYPALAQATETFIKMANAQDPMPKTFALLKKLKNKGYSIYLFSNMGEHILHDLKINHPQLLKNIDDYCVVSAENNYVHKPNLNAYHAFMRKFNPDQTLQVIFIDDLLINIKAGEKAGMIGIHFNTAQQVEHDLKLLGVL